MKKIIVYGIIAIIVLASLVYASEIIMTKISKPEILSKISDDAIYQKGIEVMTQSINKPEIINDLSDEVIYQKGMDVLAQERIQVELDQTWNDIYSKIGTIGESKNIDKYKQLKSCIDSIN
jgi:hypothetical protein